MHWHSRAAVVAMLARERGQAHSTWVCLNAQKHLNFFAQYISHRIFECMHGALNIDKKITNYTICL
jgi:hypothetical protein